MLHALFGAAMAKRLLVLIACCIPATSVFAVESLLETRMSRLERMLSERSLSDLVLQIQQLQQEMQELRGQVETQQYLLRQQGIMAPSSFGDEPGGTERFPAEPIFPFDAARDEGWGGATDSAVNGGFALPGQTVGSEQQRSGSGNAGILALPAPETSAGGERDLYRAAFDLLKARDYSAARDAFSDMVERYPQGQFADNGRYWLGEIGYVTQDYALAKEAFSLLVREYPSSPKVPSAMLKLGYVAYEQDASQDARSLLEEVVRRFPETTEARLAQGRLDRMEREGQ
ncbi:MAG: tol-pal system protein YbgF [Lamprobacter sp.]|uniref:tol-pal system protein YbgF n=1 Tax=Lamprobacter sp. TaxID=3100796 RepID=UPI002B25F9F3|nr:tol-pal system protein YbgF [Lamprobacter sp.]MEA3640147.1 tol-pal system protein YbgF [Lamprobacter sp.]